MASGFFAANAQPEKPVGACITGGNVDALAFPALPSFHLESISHGASNRDASREDDFPIGPRTRTKEAAAAAAEARRSGLATRRRFTAVLPAATLYPRRASSAVTDRARADQFPPKIILAEQSLYQATRTRKPNGHTPMVTGFRELAQRRHTLLMVSTTRTSARQADRRIELLTATAL